MIYLSFSLCLTKILLLNFILVFNLCGHLYVYICLNRIKIYVRYFSDLWSYELSMLWTVLFFLFLSGTDQNPRRPVLERFNLYELPLWGKIELMLLDMYIQQCYGVFIKPRCVRQIEWCNFYDNVRRPACPQHIMDRFIK